MTIEANILVAIGGRPKINHPDFIPTYPGHLPMGIGKGRDLEVPIKAFSKKLLKYVFMAIGQPENPIEIKREDLLSADLPEFHTIGEFYEALQKKIYELGDDIFTVGPGLQVLSWFKDEEDEDTIPIVDVDSATNAIQLIIEEGEGTSTSPFVDRSDEGEVAHYYLFEEIYEGRKIQSDGKGGYVFSGDVIPFDPTGVYPMVDNPKQEDYEPGSLVATLSSTFSYGYNSLLNALHDAFIGNPKSIDDAIGLMYQLLLNAQKLMSTPVTPRSPGTAGPVFRYVTSNPEPIATRSGAPPIFPTYGVHNPPEYSP